MENRKLNLFSISRNIIWIILIIIITPTIYILFTQKTLLLEWVLINNLSTPIIITIIIDPIGILFSLTVLTISANVLKFSTIYISEEKYKDRFTILVLLFIISINLLIFLPHFIILLLGWDGLGIVSFILVIYYQNPKSLAAGIITALTNRIGDVTLLLSIAWTLNQGHWYIINMWICPISTLQILCIILAAITKRAQIPFSRWLPAAIAAPTPVSALVHSSTLVTAGVFLIIRFYSFLHTWEYFNLLILCLAVSTILIAGLRATTECDIKKIIALSTLRQLGMIITRIGLNIPTLAYFHIITHALFKALLFICAGSFINQHLHSQDLRWIGNLSTQIPVALSCITIANIALCGFPFLAGFYSKDAIIERAINITNNIPMIILAIFRLGLTSFYSVRFRIVTIWGPQSRAPFINITEHRAIILPIIILAFLSISTGRIIRWLPPIRNSIFILPFYIKIIPLIIVTLGFLLAWKITSINLNSKSLIISIRITHFARCIIWFLVPLSSQFIIKIPLQTAHTYLKSIDQGWLELSSGNGLHFILTSLGNKTLKLLPNSPSSYIVSSSLFIISLIIICLIN